jgi:hypothetical protein
MPIFPLPANVVTGGTIQASDVANLYADINGGLDNQNIVAGGLLGSNLASNTVAIGQIKNANVQTGIQQLATKHSNGAYFNMPSGAYGFFPGLSTDSNVNTQGSLGGWRTADGDTTFDLAVAGNFGGLTNAGGLSFVIGTTTVNAILWLAVLNTTTTGTSQAFFTGYYIQSSPPYDLGDGEIPLFIFALVDSDGYPRATVIAHDPPWSQPPVKRLNLPFSLQEALAEPDAVVIPATDTEPAKTKMDILMETLDGHRAHSRNLKDMVVKLATARDRVMNVEIRDQIRTIQALLFDTTPETQQFKNRHAASVPHPFLHNDLSDVGWMAGHIPVMLDPMSKTTEMLQLLFMSGENVNGLIHDGHIQLGNTHLDKRAGPPGLTIVDHKFKNTR